MTSNRQKVAEIEDKMQVFEGFYTKVMIPGVKSIQVPKILENHRQLLEQPISEQEIDWAIANLKLDKSLELDGLTGNFHKVFKDQVIPCLRELFAFCMTVNRIPDSWKEARLTLPKKESKKERQKNVPSHAAPYRCLTLTTKQNIGKQTKVFPRSFNGKIKVLQ